MYFTVFCRHAADISSKVCQIFADPRHALCLVCHLVQIQYRHLYTAADTYGIVILCSAAAGILYIQRAAKLIVSCPDFWNNDVVSSYFKCLYNLGHGSCLCMVLCSDKLQVRVVSGSLVIMPYINRDFFSCGCCDSKRLPCVQPAESAPCILCSNPAVDMCGCIQFGI